MDIAKIAGVAIIGMLLSVMLRSKNPAAAALVALGSALVMTAMTLGGFESIFSGFSELIEAGGIEPQYYKSVIKVIGVAYFTDIISGLCRDAGEGAVAAKLEIAGRVTVLMLTLPVVTRLMEVIIDALSLI